MQDTSPAARTPRDDDTSSAVTWYEEGGDPPADEPVITSIPLPDLS